MGFFSDIKDKIFNRHHETVTRTASNTTAIPTGSLGGSAPASAPVSEPPAPVAPQSAGSPVQPAPAQSPAAAPTTAATSTAPANDVDVATILDEAVAKNGQELSWRRSIVDLMKALGIDSSLASRKALAEELHYTGDTNDSAAMNVWLHKQVLQKLAANGGKVPADLLD